MNSYEREYFISRIRSGFYILKLENVRVKVVTPTIEDEFLANEVFMESFDAARSDDILTYEEMLETRSFLQSNPDYAETKLNELIKLIENYESIH